MIQNIIFDFGGVILKHKSTIMEEMLAQIFSISVKEANELWQKEKILVMAGKVSSEEFLTRLKEELHSNKSIEEILSLWRSLYVENAKDVDWELLKFIDQLKTKYHVYLFTDTIDTNDEYNTSRNIYNRFTRVFKSNEEGLTKHNEEAFLNILHKISANPEDCIFIDDLEVNIRRAVDLGIKGILYKSKEDLLRNLSKFGISVS